MNVLEQLKFSGNSIVATLPSGLKWNIRESNGYDDELISNVALAEAGENLAAYLASICSPLDSPTKVFSLSDMMDQKCNDIYYAYLESRILNHGPKLEYKTQCQNKNCKQEFEIEQDLMEYIVDLSNPDYQPKDLYALRKYPTQETHSTFVLFDTKFRFRHLTRKMEFTSLKISKEGLHKNRPLLVRELSVEQGGEFIPLTYFSMFSSRQMGDIRKRVATLDPTWNPIVEYTCPHCKLYQGETLFEIRDFYYPGESL